MACDDVVKSQFVEMFDRVIPIRRNSRASFLRIFAICASGHLEALCHKGDYITGGHPLVNPSPSY